MALSIRYWSKYVDGHAKLLRKSEASVESDRVLRFVLDDARVISSYVQASMKNTSYKVQITLDDEDNGEVKSTSCQCPLGEFKCHHVAATLLFGYKRASKTDVKCSWLKNPKSAPPKTTLTMSELYPPKQPEYRRHLIVSTDKVRETAALTIGQRENSLWAAVRKLRFTASNFGQIIAAAKHNRLSISLKKRLLSAYNLEKRAPIEWGIIHEKNGLEAYSEKGEVTVRQTGIWLHESGILGASPDGFVQGEFNKNSIVHQQLTDQDEILPDIVEVKCPFSAREMTVIEACQSIKGFFLELTSDGRIRLKETHDYWHQIQGQLHITGALCCDLAVWTTKDLQIVRIVKDKLWATNISIMVDFYFNKFIPSL
ncbi:uncharacterized protein LOC132723641 [Ruditapes philippinarum]|uniref:uncharacterized protein LOC132723641 n=1 Tax=Ruditapes philippinarum TaxID=129788 RepID=UPI00295B3D74|nr:uncharacterized protein LOC132723641 [Ruditapes philippinarum]